MLTDSKIKDIRTTNRDQWINDPGSRGLYLRVSRSSSPGPITTAAWVIRQKRDGKTTRNVIGHWPAMDLAQARQQSALVAGVDVRAQMSVNALSGEYDRAVLADMKSRNQVMVYVRHTKDQFGTRLVSTLRRHELVRMIQQYSKERGTRSSDRLLSYLRGLFGYAVEIGVLQQSPIDGVGKRVTGYKAIARDRVLTDTELQALWTWQGRQAALLRFLALTGLRIGEAQQGHRQGHRWIVPAEISKNGDAHWIHLTASACDQLDQAGGSFVTSPTASQSWLKRKLLRGGYQDEDRWTPHDLRRTSATRMAEAGVAYHVVERVLNHRLPGVAQVYNRAELEKERIAAAEVLEKALLEVVA
jgi:integrase